MDSWLEPPILTDDLEEEVEERIRIRQYLLQRSIESLRRRDRIREERRRMAAQDLSDDSDVDAPFDLKNLEVTLTPSGSTPASDEAKPKEEKEKLDPALVGMSVGLKNLYSGKEDKRGRFQWQTTIPEDVGKPAEDAETAKWALIVRHVKVRRYILIPLHRLRSTDCMLYDRSTMILARFSLCTPSSSSLHCSRLCSRMFSPVIQVSPWDCSDSSSAADLSLSFTAGVSLRQQLTSSEPQFQRARLRMGMLLLSPEHEKRIDTA